MTDLRVLAATPRTLSFLLAPTGAQYALPRQMAWTLHGADGATVAAGKTDTVSVFVTDLEPACTYELRCDLGRIAAHTPPCTGMIIAQEFGVSTDAENNAQSFAKAIAAVPSGGSLRLLPGRYRSGPIFLKARMTLHLDAGAELVAINDRHGWPQLPAHDHDGRVMGSWEGLPDRCFAALVTGFDCDALAITGAGVIDGGGADGDWWEWPKETRDGARRPRILHLAHSRKVTLSGLTIRNSPSWTIHAYRVNDFRAAALHIENPDNSPNTDGLNPESCVGVNISATRFSVGDDCIAIKSGKRGAGVNAHLAPTRDVTISHCLMQRGHGAVVMGSEMSGGISGVTIRDCEFAQTDRGLRIKTRRGRGGKVCNIALNNVAMTDVPTPLAINAFYFCDPDGKDNWVQDRSPATPDDTTPQISDISLTDVTARGVALAGVAMLGLPEAPITGVHLDNFTISFNPDAAADVPLMALGVPPVRHLPIFSENAEITGEVAVISNPEDRVAC